MKGEQLELLFPGYEPGWTKPQSENDDAIGGGILISAILVYGFIGARCLGWF